jgi:hypothetical protein
MSESIGLGDIVTLGWSDGYADGTVVEVHKDGTVDVFRPAHPYPGLFDCGA